MSTPEDLLPMVAAGVILFGILVVTINHRLQRASRAQARAQPPAPPAPPASSGESYRAAAIVTVDATGELAAFDAHRCRLCGATGASQFFMGRRACSNVQCCHEHGQRPIHHLHVTCPVCTVTYLTGPAPEPGFLL